MTTTKRDLQALHYLAQRLREETPRAGKWHDAGLRYVLAKLEGHNLAITIERVTRHAADPEARTPAAIERPFVPEAVAPGPPRPLKPAEACRNCGQAKHQPHAECDGRAPARTADVTEPVAHLRELRQETTAALCSHGVLPANCNDHRTTETTSEPATEETA